MCIRDRRWADCRVMRKKGATLRALTREQLLRIFAQRRPHAVRAGAGSMPPLTPATSIAALWAADHGVEERVVTRALSEAELPEFLLSIELARLDGVLQRPPPGGRMPACAHFSYTPHVQAISIYRAPRAVSTHGTPTGGSVGTHAPAASRRLPCWLSEPSEVSVQSRISPTLEARLRTLAVESVVDVVQRYLDTVAVGVRVWSVELAILLRDEPTRPVVPGAAALDEWAGAQLWLGWACALRLASERTTAIVADQWVAPLHRARELPRAPAATTAVRHMRRQQSHRSLAVEQAERRLWAWPVRDAVPFGVPMPKPVPQPPSAQLAAAARAEGGGVCAASGADNLSPQQRALKFAVAGSLSGASARGPRALASAGPLDERYEVAQAPSRAERAQQAGLSGSVFHMPTPLMGTYAFPPWWSGWRAPPAAPPVPTLSLIHI